MERCEIDTCFIDSLKHCFICLNKILNKKEEGGDQVILPDTDEKKYVSFHYASYYLRMDKRTIFEPESVVGNGSQSKNFTTTAHKIQNNNNNNDQEDTGEEEKTNDINNPKNNNNYERKRLKVELCEECENLNEVVEAMFRLMERAQIELTARIREIYWKLRQANETGREAEFWELAGLSWMRKDEVDVIRRARRETIMRCSDKLKNTFPLVMMERLPDKLLKKTKKPNKIEFINGKVEDSTHKMKLLDADYLLPMPISPAPDLGPDNLKKNEKVEVDYNEYNNGEEIESIMPVLTPITSNCQSTSASKFDRLIPSFHHNNSEPDFCPSHHRQEIVVEKLVVVVDSQLENDKDFATEPVLPAEPESNENVETSLLLLLPPPERKTDTTDVSVENISSTSETSDHHHHDHTDDEPASTPPNSKKSKYFQCPHCERTFASKTNLFRHTTCGHPDNKTYACNSCNQTFTRLEDCNVHNVTFHQLSQQIVSDSTVSSTPSAGKSHKCHKCLRTFWDRTSWKKHKLESSCRRRRRRRRRSTDSTLKESDPSFKNQQASTTFLSIIPKSSNPLLDQRRSPLNLSRIPNRNGISASSPPSLGRTTASISPSSSPSPSPPPKKRSRSMESVFSSTKVVNSVFYCHKCKKPYSSKGNLEKHKRQKHLNDQEEYVCRRCKKVFTKLYKFTLHSIRNDCSSTTSESA